MYEKPPLKKWVRKGSFHELMDTLDAGKERFMRIERAKALTQLHRMNVSDAEKRVLYRKMLHLIDARYRRSLNKAKSDGKVHDYVRNHRGRIVQSSISSTWHPKQANKDAVDKRELARVMAVKWKAKVDAKRQFRNNVANLRAGRYDKARALELKQWIIAQKQRAAQRARARRHKLAGRFK
jgi:hypothetical protein